MLYAAQPGLQTAAVRVFLLAFILLLIFGGAA
jgi:hypothetical protein